MTLGGKLIKNAMGIDLLHLMIGSEGALGVITKSVFRMVPKPRHSALLLASFNERLEAIETSAVVSSHMIVPLAAEYMDHELVELTAEYLRWRLLDD